MSAEQKSREQLSVDISVESPSHNKRFSFSSNNEVFYSKSLFVKEFDKISFKAILLILTCSIGYILNIVFLNVITKVISWVVSAVSFSLFQYWLKNNCVGGLAKLIMKTFEFYYIEFSSIVYTVTRLSNQIINVDFYKYNENVILYYFDSVFWHIIFLICVFDVLIIDSLINVNYKFKVFGLVILDILWFFVLVKIVLFDDKQYKLCMIKCSDLENISASCLITVILFTIKYSIKIIHKPNRFVLLKEDIFVKIVVSEFD